MHRRRYHHWLRTGSGMVAALAVAAGCSRDAGSDLTGTSAPREDLNLAVEVSSATARKGERIAVALRADAADKLLGLQGSLHFDPAKLRFVGQASRDNVTLEMVNDDHAAKGELAYLASNPRDGLGGHVAPLVFEVLGADYDDDLKYSLDVAVLRNEVEVTRAAMGGTTVAADLAVPAAAQRMGVAEWAAVLAKGKPGLKVADGLSLAPGQRRSAGLVYGDVNLSGTFTTIDIATVGRAALGRPDALLILNTDSAGVGGAANRDMVIAANVRPVSPIGGADPNRVINVTDVQALQITFLDPADVDPQGVVNTQIRETEGGSCSNMVVSGTLTGTHTWDVPRPCFVQLDGKVYVGDEATGAAGAATVTIAKNTLVKGNSSINPSALFVTRNGRLIAIGTQAEPIEFSCTAAVPTPACWGGVFIAGNASINEQQGVSLPPSPAIPGRQTGGANQRQGEGGAPAIGGNNDADSSGVLRYVRIEYGGFLLSPNNELNCLTLGSVGYGTDIDHVQCHKGTDDGFEFFGGTVDVQYLVSTENEDDAFDISFGYNGRAQYVIATVPAGSDSKAIEADNTETVATFGNTPATSPELYNFTLIGNAASYGAFHLRRGTSPEMGHFFVTGFPKAVDIDDAATCTRMRTDTVGIHITAHENAGDGLILRRSRLAMQGGTVGDSDADPTPSCGGFTDPNVVERDWVATTSFQNDTTPATAAALLINPVAAAGNVSDFRPQSGMLVAPGGWALPPARANHINFDAAGASMIGAVGAAPLTLNTVPWYAGWTRQP